MSGARNLHRIAGALERLRHEAAAGACTFHPDIPAVGFIESWDLYPKGVCTPCKTQGERLGYTVHPDPLREDDPRDR
jgi:hypothetical protein